jgi:hypothetical protein
MESRAVVELEHAALVLVTAIVEAMGGRAPGQVRAQLKDTAAGLRPRRTAVLTEIARESAAQARKLAAAVELAHERRRLRARLEVIKRQAAAWQSTGGQLERWTYSIDGESVPVAETVDEAEPSFDRLVVE